MTMPKRQGRVGEYPGAPRQSDARLSDPRGASPARPTPWLADGNGEGFESDSPTQPLPTVTAPVRGPAHSREAAPVGDAASVREAPLVREAAGLRDVPVRDIARMPEPVRARGASPARVAAPAMGTLRDRVSGPDEVVPAAWSPGPTKIPAPIKTSFRWWIVAVTLAVVAMTLSVVLAVLYAGRYGTSAAGGATAGSVLFEVLILGGAGFVVVRMRAGDDWARTLLAGGGGLVALVVAMNTAGQFSFGSSLVAGFTTAVATLRLFEAAAAAVAIWHMFQPGAGKYFDPRWREE